MTATQPQTLASEFARRIRAELSPRQVDDLLTRNAQEDDHSVCHSHDFCDANQVMLDALESLGIEWQGAGDETCNTLISEAWGIAKYTGFDAPSDA